MIKSVLSEQAECAAHFADRGKNMEHYLDNAATTKPCAEAAAAVMSCISSHYGNPSSLYRIGRAAKEALNDARTVVGKCLNAAEPVNEKNDYAPGEIVFTGGGDRKSVV